MAGLDCRLGENDESQSYRRKIRDGSECGRVRLQAENGLLIGGHSSAFRRSTPSESIVKLQTLCSLPRTLAAAGSRADFFLFFPPELLGPKDQLASTFSSTAMMKFEFLRNIPSDSQLADQHGRPRRNPVDPCFLHAQSRRNARWQIVVEFLTARLS